MAFPSTILDLRADLGLSGYASSNWTSVTSFVYSERAKPTINRGRPDEATSPQPSSATFQLDDRDGRFSIHNPLGAYYGSLTRNTPIRFHVPEPTPYARFESDDVSYFSTPSATALNLTGDLEARIDLTLTDWTASFLCGKWSTAAGNYQWAFLLNSDGTLAFQYTTNGSTIRTISSSAPIPFPNGRISLIVTYSHFDANVNFYYATTINGTQNKIGKTVNNGITGALFAGTANLQVGFNSYYSSLTGYQGTFGAGNGIAFAPASYTGINGQVYEFQLRNGIAGTLVADPIFSGQADGTTSFADSQSNTWTANGTAVVSARKFRYHGEVAEWPPRISDPSAVDPYIDVQANGLLRRIQQGNAPLDSAYTRAWKMQTGIYAPVAYWPGEDGTASQQIASGLPNGQAMNISGTTTTFSANASFLCSNPIPTPGTSIWNGHIPAYTAPVSNPANVFRILLSVPSGGDTNNVFLARFFTTGTVAKVELQYSTLSSGSLELFGYDSSGNKIIDSGDVGFSLNGNPCIVEFSLTTSGANVIGNINVLKLGSTVMSSSNTTLTTATIGNATAVVINPNGSTVNSAIGQITVQSSYAAMDSASSAFDLVGPLNAWEGETAGLRFARLCNEQGFLYRINGYPSTSVPMGAQTTQTFMSLLQECEDADNGMIFEPRQSLSLGYNCYNSLVNQAPFVTLNYSTAQVSPPLEPTDDDLLTANDVILSRTSGGSSVEITEKGSKYSTGFLSTSNPPAGVGNYQLSSTVNLYGDGQLANGAGWLVHLGTVPDLRFPSIGVDLARSEVSAISNTIQNIDLGDYLAISSPPTWIGYDTVKTMVWGTSEQLGGYIYTIQYVTQPESSFEVLVAGTGATSDNRADTDGSTLHSGVNSAATVIGLDTASGSLPWTTVAGDLPFDIIVSGERMTVTAMTAGLGGNLLTGQNAGFEGGIGNWNNLTNCSLADTAVQAHSGSNSMQMTSSASGQMVAGSCSNANVLTQAIACNAGDTVTLSAWFRTAVSARSCAVGLRYFDISGTTIGGAATFGSTITDSTSAWTQASASLVAPANTAYCRVHTQVQATGGASEVHYVDDVICSLATSTQQATVTRAVNGVVKSQSAGAAVNLFSPVYIALV